MKFDHDYLMGLADEFEKKAMQLLETAESIRETAGIMSPSAPAKKTSPTPEPKPEPAPAPVVTPPPVQPIEEQTTESGPPKFTRLETLILDSMENKPAGIDIDAIVGHCRLFGNIGTKNSIHVTVNKLAKRGHIARVGSGQYALKTAFNATLQ